MKRFVLGLICLLNLSFLEAASLKRGDQHVIETVEATKAKMVQLEGELDVFSRFLVQAIEAHSAVDAAAGQDDELQVQLIQSGREQSKVQQAVTARKQKLTSGREKREVAVSKKSIEEEALLKVHDAKRRLIQAAIIKKIAENRRSVNAHPVIKRQADLEEPELKDFISKLPTDQQQLIEDHPSVAGELLEAIHTPGASGEEGAADVKRSLRLKAHYKRQVELTDPRLQEFINSLSEDQQLLIEDHPSVAGELLLALDAPVATGEVQETVKRNVQAQHKRQSVFAPEVEAFIATLPDDQKQLVEDHPSEAGALLEALKQPGATGEETVSGEDGLVAKRGLHEGDFQNLIKECLIHIGALQLVIEKASEMQNVEPADTLEQMTDKIAADIQEAKDKGFKLEELLAALKEKSTKSKTS